MTSVEYTSAREALLRRAAVVASDSPSLTNLYELEEFFEYNGFGCAARKVCIERWRELGVERVWLDELRRPPPDLTIWFRWGCQPGLARALQEAEQAWMSKPPDRIFAPHQHVGPPSDVAALHLGLLLDIDPTAAVEYAASLPSEHFIWAAAWILGLGDRPELVDLVLARSPRDAALLSLACTLEAMHTKLRESSAALSRQSANLSELEVAEQALVKMWETELPARLKQLATTIIGRSDDGAVLGPWLRHLVLAVDRAPFQQHDPMPRLARLAIEETYKVLEKASAPVQIASHPTPHASCIVARALVERAVGQTTKSLWSEWQALMVAEHLSLASCRGFAWAQVGDALLQTGAATDVWLSTARALLPMMRHLERASNSGPLDLVIHLLIPAVHASAGARDARLWWAAYDLARRHFLVTRPHRKSLSYEAPSWIFAAFPHVFGDDATQLDVALALLPTADHRTWAAQQIATNAPSSADDLQHHTSIRHPAAAR